MLTNEQIQDLIDQDYGPQFFVWRMEPTNDAEDLSAFFDECIMSDLNERVLALMMEDDLFYADAEKAIDNEDWLVLTDDEADRLAYEYADSWTDDALEEIPKHLQRYFDAELYCSDLLDDGRGHILAYYDSEEREQTVNGTTYYLYRR
jgi:hypothetical protein